MAGHEQEWEDIEKEEAAQQAQQQQLHPPKSLFQSAAGPSQGTRSQNSSPTRVENSSSTHHAGPPKRLFSAAGALACTHGAGNDVNPDCAGSEYSRSLDDINNTARMEEKTEGMIKLTITNLCNLRQKQSTDYNYIANLPWRLAAKTESTKRTSHVKFFSVYIDCNPESESTLWSCDAVVEFRLISQRDGIPDFSRQFTNKFNYNSNNWGFPSFMEWSEIQNPEKGYMKNDKVIVEAHITVQKVVGVRKIPSFDFLSFQPNTSDVVLVIEGKRLHVSKNYLALYSPVFHAMFFSKFKEREKREIPIEDVIFDEFLELLNVVYPSHKQVNSDNVEYLLELGDKFEIHYVMDECERYLMSTEDIALVTKLVWADQYCLAKLQHTCIRTFKSSQDIKNLKMTEEYKNLSDTTKAALLEKVLKLI